jgi:hypothetical protein
MERELFSYTSLDGDLMYANYYDVLLKTDIGKHKQGERFHVAGIDFKKGKLKLYKYDKLKNEFACVGEYDLELKVKGA